MTPLKFRRIIMGWIVIIGMVSMTSLIGSAWVAIENKTVVQKNVTVSQLPPFTRMKAIRKY